MDPEADRIVLVMDNLNTRRPASRDDAYAPKEAERLAAKANVNLRFPTDDARTGF